MVRAASQERFPMPTSVESEIRSRVEAFTAELVALIRASAVDVVNAALGRAGVRGRRGRAPSPAVSTRAKGAKRSSEELARLTDTLGAFIKKNPGLRIEQIGKALGLSTKDLALPVKKLLAAKQISTKGQKRSTTYFPR